MRASQVSRGAVVGVVVLNVHVLGHLLTAQERSRACRSAIRGGSVTRLAAGHAPAAACCTAARLHPASDGRSGCGRCQAGRHATTGAVNIETGEDGPGQALCHAVGCAAQMPGQPGVNRARGSPAGGFGQESKAQHAEHSSPPKGLRMGPRLPAKPIPSRVRPCSASPLATPQPC